MILYAEIKEQKELETQNWGKSIHKTGCAFEVEHAVLAMGQADGRTLERLDKGERQFILQFITACGLRPSRGEMKTFKQGNDICS